MNKWNIPDWLEREVPERDTACVYCGCEFADSNSERQLMPSWEHIVNDAKIVPVKTLPAVVSDVTPAKEQNLCLSGYNLATVKRKESRR